MRWPPWIYLWPYNFNSWMKFLSSLEWPLIAKPWHARIVTSILQFVLFPFLKPCSNFSTISPHCWRSKYRSTAPLWQLLDLYFLNAVVVFQYNGKWKNGSFWWFQLIWGSLSQAILANRAATNVIFLYYTKVLFTHDFFSWLLMDLR